MRTVVVDDTRHWAIVTNGAGQYHCDMMLHCFIGDALFQQTRLDRFLDEAKCANGVDGTQVVPMATLDLFAAFHINAK